MEELHPSVAKVLLLRSPRHARWQLDHPAKPSREMDLGSVVHALLLGAKQDRIVVVDASDFRTKAAQQARDEAYEARKVPIVRAKYEEAANIAGQALRQLADYDIMLSGESELTLLWSEKTTGGRVVHCCGTLDHLDGEWIYDVKTGSDASPDAQARQHYAMGNDLQAAAYLSAVEHCRPELAGRVRFAFIGVETSPPYVVQVTELDAEYLEVGRRRWARAVAIWERCQRTGNWPGYSPPGLSVRLALPRWAAMREEEESYGSADAQV